MLQAFIQNKVSRWLTKPAWELEDLLTSVVFGSCEYAGKDGWDLFLHPFLSAAKATNDNENLFGKKLPKPENITSIKYYFWKSLSSFSTVRSIPGKKVENNVNVNQSIPEVILEIEADQTYYIFMV